MFKSGLVLALVAASLLAGCGGGDDDDSGGAPVTGAATPQPGGSITIAVDGDAGSLDPIVDDTYAATLVDLQVFDTLIRVQPDGEYGPMLAESWEQPDEETWVFRLRDGVTFHDGTAFDAEAVKFNLDAIRDPKSGSSWQGELQTVDEIVVTDPLTVEIRLKEPFQPLLSVLSSKAGMIRSPAAVEKLGERFASEPVGTGAFTFVEWVKNDHIELARNPEYWDEGKPYLDTVTFRPITDPTAKVNDLISGRVDTVDYVPPEQIERVETGAGLVLKNSPPPFNSVVYLAMRTDEPPMDDPDVRQAINLAIDREAIVESVVFGAGTVARSPLTPTSWGLTDDVPAIPYDPERARELLGGRELEISFLEPPSYPQVTQVIEQNLADIGVATEIRRMDWGQLIDTYYKGDYQLMLSDLLGNQRPDPNAGLSLFYETDGSLNATAYSDDEMDRLLEEGRSLQDRGARQELYAEVQRKAQEAAPYAPIYHPNTVRAWAEDVQGMEIPADGLIYLTDVWRGEA